MAVWKRSRYALIGLAMLSDSPPTLAQDGVGSGPRMAGHFGPPQARTTVGSGKGPDDLVVSLTRRGSCSGELAGPARAFSSHVVTLSQSDPSGGGTCTVDVTYAPDFAAIGIRESAACLSFHGAGCTFEGRFARAR